MSNGTDIARLEWIRTWRDPVMRVVLVLFAIAAGYAALTGTRWAAQRQIMVSQVVSEADDVRATRRERFATVTAKGEQPKFDLIYATAAQYGAALPGAPLATLSAGQAEGYPAAANITPFGDPYAMFDTYATGLENPSVLAAGRFDLAFVLVVLLPLLLIAATYDFWSRDVENGSARFQLAQPVRPARLILTRAATRGGSLLVAAVVIALGWLVALGARDLAGLSLLALVVLAYGIFWIALTTLINLFVRASTTAALASGTAWLAIVMLLPAAGAAIADLVAPPPSAMAHSNMLRGVGLELRAANQAAARAAATANSGRAYPATLWHRRAEIQQREARLGPLYRSYAAEATRHRMLADGLRFLSPAIIAQDALDRIAGTDASRALAFQAQARAMAGDARRLAFDWMDRDHLMTLTDHDAPLLRFSFAEPSRRRPLALDILALAFFALLPLALAALRLRRGASKLL
jgi:ABC-2 type transport system permease protein